MQTLPHPGRPERARRPGPVSRVRVVELRQDDVRRHEDRLAVEEPLEIRLSAPGLPATRLGITMRTPGHDFELAAGWVVHEGVTTPDAIESVRYCTDADLRAEQEFNVVTLDLAAPPRRLPAARMVTSACGVCGSDAVDDVLGRAAVPAEEARVEHEVLLGLPDALRTGQPGFDRTGGMHAAGLATPSGALLVVREDVGRHNAVDKVIGHRLLAHEPVPPVLVLSGRIGFELVQKAVVSGIQVIVAVGAPTSLAVDLAARAGITVVGFTRRDRAVVHTGEHRLGL